MVRAGGLLASAVGSVGVALAGAARTPSDTPSHAAMAGTNPHLAFTTLCSCVGGGGLTHAVKHGKPRLRQARQDSQIHIRTYVCMC